MRTSMTFRAAAAVIAAALAGFLLSASPADAAEPAWTKNCKTLRAKFPNGLGKVLAVDVTTGTPVTNFTRSNKKFKKARKANSSLDGDRDKIACELSPGSRSGSGGSGGSGGGPSCAAQAVSATVTNARAVILQETNQYRAANGAAPVQLNECLNTVAQNWAAHMAATGTQQHNILQHPYYYEQYPAGWTSAGENIAWGPNTNASNVVDNWIASPAHAANLRDPAFTHLGVGYAQGGPNVNSFVQNFAAY
jgi:uncharacterized protein YkwD